MNIASIKVADCANGPGMRTSVFVSGCTRHCPGCFNEIAWDFNYGERYTDELGTYIMSTMEGEEVDGLTILGGEPMEPANQKGVFSLVCRAKEMKKSVWLYSGYTFEELIDPESPCYTFLVPPILLLTDVLVDGPFLEGQKDISLRFRGSRNQRIIDVQASVLAGKVVLVPN